LRTREMQRHLVMIAVVALLAIPQLAAAADQPTPPPKGSSATDKSAPGQLPKLWHREPSTKDSHVKDFRVEVSGDVFRAEWVNLPADALKLGAYIRTECRRTGTKWVGSSSVYQAVAIPGAPGGKNMKPCHFTVRFEVDSITPQKIIFHSEVLRNIDITKCQLLQTDWEEFTWVPKR